MAGGPLKENSSGGSQVGGLKKLLSRQVDVVGRGAQSGMYEESRKRNNIGVTSCT